MKTTFRFSVFLFIFLVAAGATALAQPFYWAQRAGGITPDEGADISSDAVGNVYTTGYFSGSATFGTATLNSSGITDVFLTKNDAQGLYEWVIKAGGSGSDRAHAIKTDAQGNSYITGYYYGTATFGNQSITSQGEQDVFIAKYDNAGILVWATSAGGADADIGNGINVDDAGNVVITGEFTGTAMFGTNTLTSMNNTVDVFTAKLDADGNFIWAEKGSAPDIDRGLDVACDDLGNIYVTGQFTDTITFDNTHNNNTYNAIFVVKYNANGDEQWFRRIGAGSMNVVSGIAVDGSDNVYITGDFTGNVIFFGTTNTTLTNTYTNRIFLAKYNSSGDLLWAEADGSSSEITSKNLVVDDAGNPHIVGNFKCRLNEYADIYGQGTFNSVGYWDIFVSKYNTNGVWQLSRSCGGRQNDYGAGIALNNLGQIHITGSFFQQLIFPLPANLLGYNTTLVYNGGSYCADTYYGLYRSVTSAGNSDVFIFNVIDPLREPYDYYRRTGSGCMRDVEGVCINGNVNACPDTLSFCSFGSLFAFTFTTPAGPAFVYDWEPAGSGNAINVGSTGYYSVTQTSVDGCFTSTDSIYVNIFPAPPIPTITDNLDTNINAIVAGPVTVCSPDSVLLTAGGFSGNNYGWIDLENDTNGLSTIWASETGQYEFTYMDTNGCVRSNNVIVIVEEGIDSIVPGMTNLPAGDSISICLGDIVTMITFDSLTNSNPDSAVICPPFADVLWTVSATNFFISDMDVCYYGFQPQETGDYLSTAMIIQRNNCDTDTSYITRTIYIEVNPLPDIGPVSISLNLVGNAVLCPGDSALLIASPALNYEWDGPGNTGNNTNDSLWVYQQGNYIVSTTVTDTNEFGCIAYAMAFDSVLFTTVSQPTISMIPANGLMCPDDSVRITCNGSGSFQWYGPSGLIGGNTSIIYVNTPGFYYCVRTDVSGCELLSNTVEVNQYATPFLLVTPDAALCLGDSAVIEVITNPGSTIQWQSPFSGSSLTQLVFQPGTYTCMVTSCGIQTAATAVVVESTLSAVIQYSGATEFCDGDSVVLFTESSGNNILWEPVNSIDSAITVFESGTYTLTVSDNSGCTAVDAIDITVTPDTIIPELVLSPGNVLCNDQSLTISVVANAGSSVQWLSPLSGSSLQQVIDSAGTYSCIITSCGVPTQQSVTVTAATVVAAITANGDIVFCEGDSVNLTSAAAAENYLWQSATTDTIDISDSIAITVFESGNYLLTVADTNGCTATDSITVNAVENNLSVPLVSDTAICPGGYAILIATASGEINWYDIPSGGSAIATGATYTTPVLTTAATYYVMQQDEFCESEKAPVTVVIADCETITVPNVFTPNGDGVNDEYTFPIVGATCFNCKIYNRWGRLLYEWTDATKGWDGTNQRTGNVVNDGTYFYVLNWCSATAAQKEEAGFIQLLK